MQLIRHPSPNHGERRDGLVPELVVIHFTAMADCGEALARLCAPEHQVSAHYLIGRDGTITALVAETARAWHAGSGCWAGRGDVNSRSIGIELDNDGLSPFPAPQMDALEALLPGVMARWSIRPEAVIGHSDMAPDRKADPGPRFDWRRLALAGLSVWPSPADGVKASADEARFLAHAAAFGYPADVGFAPVLTAFRLRFRPWASGPLDAADMQLAADLAARFPVDPPGAGA